MLSRVYRIGGALVLAVVAIASLVLFLLASLWVPWHMLPAGDIKIAWTSQAASRVPIELPSEFNHLRTAVWRGVYVQPRGAAGHNATLLVLPKLPFQRATPAVLEAAGWSVERLGPYILATHGDSAPLLQSPRTTLTATIATLAASRWPLWPDAVAALPRGLGPLNESTAMVITASDSMWRFVVDRSIAAPAGSNAALPTDMLDTVTIGAPQFLWKNMPPAAWDELLRPALKFTRTQPPITQTLATMPHAAVYQVPAGELALVVEDANEQFALAATTWVQEEERRDRLVQRAFRLPDGTLGYEKIPGDPAIVFAPSDDVGCRGPVEDRTTLWLCRQDNQTALSTSRAHALAALAYQPGTPLTVNIGPTQFTTLHQRCPVSDALGQIICQIQSIAWQGTNKYQAGVMHWR